MRILVLGAGIIGVTTAYELARDGHEVTVIDQNEAAAQGTSFANAGMVACGHAFAWASPRAPRMLLRSAFGVDQPIRFKPKASPALWKWALAFLRECRAERALRNTAVKHRLCVYSQARLRQIVDETGVDYDAVRTGLLYFHRSEATLAQGAAGMRYLMGLGQKIRPLDRGGVTETEPSLGPISSRIAGGFYSETDESGDARSFTLALAEACRKKGVVFKMGEKIERLALSGSDVAHVATDRGKLAADAYVLALGPYSAKFARQGGVALPVYPVKGYSVTFPLREGAVASAPRMGIVDEDNLLAVTPLGRRLRATSVAEIAGFDTSHRPRDFAPMVRKLKALFPEAADYEQPSYWVGLRPMTPDGPPRIGRALAGKLYVNTGQGHMGWTMAAGSARIVADMIKGRTPEIDVTGMEVVKDGRN